MPVRAPLPIDNGQNNQYELEKLMHPVDASDFSEAESEVVTQIISRVWTSNIRLGMPRTCSPAVAWSWLRDGEYARKR
jgi:hypothetical protein